MRQKFNLKEIKKKIFKFHAGIIIATLLFVSFCFFGCAINDCAFGDENCECEIIAHIDGPIDKPGTSGTFYKCREKKK